ncbi:DHBP synthase RibB-like alpha/beta domain-containing protein [Amylocystis lapponica]|nr:DHBP synthase RibB-like alpha/beta domain-containing protein [Amylocystis lapponica]
MWISLQWSSSIRMSPSHLDLELTLSYYRHPTAITALARHPMMAAYSTQILHCDPSSISFTPSGDPEFTCQITLEALQAASRLLHDRETVAFPTETVYGLGALALDATAAAKIFSTKGRPPDNPLIVHVSSFPMLRSLLPRDYTIPKIYDVLMKHFWPGALTLLFPADPSQIPPIITANQRTVAIRMPSHPVARALIAIANAPIAAPSANSSGKPSPTRAQHVFKDLDGKLGLILDGGQCGVGLESTVVDALHDDGNVRVLRPGGITVEDIETAVRQDMGESSSIPRVLVHRRDYRDEVLEEAPTTPGMKYRHYSPAVPVILLCTSSAPPSGMQRIQVATFLQSLRERAPKPSGKIKIGLLTPSDSVLLADLTAVDEGIEWHRYPLGPIADPSVSAQRLFDGLLTLDNAGVDLILAEEIKEDREGLAVMNRMRKAAGESAWLDVSSS